MNSITDVARTVDAPCFFTYRFSFVNISLKRTLDCSSALAIMRAALNASQTLGYRPMAIVVVDTAGQTKACARDDGATHLRLDIARGKACSAVGMGVSSRVLTERAQKMPAFFSAVAATASQPFIPHTGAVLVKSETGEILGAVGASGGTGDEDEAICIAGVQAVGLVAG